MRCFLLACAGATLDVAIATGPVRAGEPPEIRWDEVSSGETELARGKGFDLDFQDFRASEPDFQFEPWEGAMFWAPSHGTMIALVGPGDLQSFDMKLTESVKPSRERLYLCGGSAEAIQPGTILVGTTSNARYVKVSIDSCGETLRFRWTTYDRRVLVQKPQPGALEAPVLKTPPDTMVFEHDPRDLLLTWSKVAGAVSYSLELDCRGCCAPRKELFCGEQENGTVFQPKVGLTTSAYYTIWQGPYAGRWRVAAVGANGKTGPWSAWYQFSFK